MCRDPLVRCAAPSSHQRLRDTLVDAAHARTSAVGRNPVRMGGVATTAGVSRQTVYNEFGSKAGLAEALARAEAERFVGNVRAALVAHGADVRADAYARTRRRQQDRARTWL
ncbi:TetR family transcriptional regulator [Micromonospora sp. DT201]|uniref:TetR family transcriptional regulator n=1 Tax=Micromonospora sp. DT201 TaxID=3393442 RepID=UPI003CF109B8